MQRQNPIEELKKPSVNSEKKRDTTTFLFKATPLVLTDDDIIVETLKPLLTPTETHFLSASSKKYFALFPNTTDAARQEFKEIFYCIGMCNQYKAAELLKKDPSLCLVKGEYRDPFNRYFSSITFVQYAAWSRNMPMLNMLREFLSPDQFRQQIETLELKSTKHGKAFSFTPLIQVMEEFLKIPVGPARPVRGNVHAGCENLWTRRIGKAQRESVMTVLIQRYKMLSLTNVVPFVEGRGLGFDGALMRGVFSEAVCKAINTTRVAHSIIKEDLKCLKKMDKTSAFDYQRLLRELDLEARPHVRASV